MLKLFKLAGITFRFHWVFVLLLFIMAFYGFLEETLIIFGLVLLHEAAHLLTARACGLEAGDVELFPFGGVASVEDVLELDPQVETNVALAGPLLNFALVAAAVLLYVNIPAWRGQELLYFFIRCNLVLGFFNLLPALPLDGGRILRARLATGLGFRQATDLSVRLSQIIALILLSLGLYLFYTGHFHITLFFAAFFLYYAAEKERTAAMYSFFRGLNRKKKLFYQQGVIPLTTLMVLEQAPLKEVLRRFVIKKFHRVVVVNKEDRVLGEITENEVFDAIVRHGLLAPVSKALRRK